MRRPIIPAREYPPIWRRSHPVGKMAPRAQNRLIGVSAMPGHADEGCPPGWGWLAAAARPAWVPQPGAGVVPSGGLVEELLDSGGDELRLLGLDQVCRVDAFVARAGQAVGVAALVLEYGGVLITVKRSGQRRTSSAVSRQDAPRGMTAAAPGWGQA